MFDKTYVKFIFAFLKKNLHFFLLIKKNYIVLFCAVFAYRLKMHKGFDFYGN